MIVGAPCPGHVIALGDVPDPVFAAEMVGPGVAIEPAPGETTVVSPIAGRVVKVHPHAFVVLGDGGVGVLVHLGIDTVKLDGQGFEVLTEQGATVAAGDPMVRWDPALAVAAGMSPVVPVCVMDRKPGSLEVSTGGDVATGDVLFSA